MTVLDISKAKRLGTLQTNWLTWHMIHQPLQSYFKLCLIFWPTIIIIMEL